MKKNMVILAFTAILFTLTGVLTIYAQDEKNKQFPTLLAVNNDSATIDAKIDVDQVPTEHGTVAFIKAFEIKHGQQIITDRIELGFRGIRLEIKDSNGSCNEKVNFDWSKANTFSGELSCPNSKTKVYYKIEKTTVENGETKVTVILSDISV